MIGLLAAAAATLACPAEHAHYVLRGAPQVTAYFRVVDSGDDWPSHLALATTFAGSGHIYWWVPWNGGSNGQQNVASTTDATKRGWQPPSPDDGPRPHGDLEYFATDAGYTFLDAVPVAGRPAPAHFMLAGLGRRLYGPGFGDAQDEPGATDTRQFFDLVRCEAGR